MKTHHAQCRIKDYPRPQLVRNNWLNLNGKWDFLFDKDNVGLENDYQKGFSSDMTINVPFAYQCEKSGIGVSECIEYVWYQRIVKLTFAEGERVILHLEGSDYQTQVYLNGAYVGKNCGCYHRASFDVTDVAKRGDNVLVLRIHDDYSTEQPRGKQRALDHDYGCWYIDTAGLYKTVWAEVVPSNYIEDVKITPILIDNTVSIEYSVREKVAESKIKTTVTFEGREIASAVTRVISGKAAQNIYLGENIELWEIGDGKIYDVKAELLDGDSVIDEIGSYFGMREIEIKDGKILLNGKPLYQKLALDQGYWRGSDLTAPDEEALEKDIVLLQSMGFNGVRKHEKVEDERFMYYADVYGFIVWGEMPSIYNCSQKGRDALRNEWSLVVKQLYNHPSVFVWVCANESWGVEEIRYDKSQQDFVNALYADAKAIDKTRPVITNDGWEHTCSDILTIHHYTQSGEELHNFFKTVDKCIQRKFDGHERGAFADGYHYNGQPIIISEFGGTSFRKDMHDGKWGYGEAVGSSEEFLNRFSSLIEAIDTIPFVSGYCYTQVTDVHHEMNGLMDFDHVPKESPEIIKEILTRNGR